MSEIEKIYILKVLACLLVIYMHIPFIPNIYHLSELVKVIARNGVEIFLLITGFLRLGKWIIPIL